LPLFVNPIFKEWGYLWDNKLMNYLPFALAAYLLHGIVILIDKLLIEKRIPNPLFHIFYISAFSLLTLIIIPFVKLPGWEVLILAWLGTLLWTAGTYCMLRALRIGVASRVIPAIGTLIPVGLALFGVLSNSLTTNQLWSVSFLILGFFVVVLPYFKGKLSKEETTLEILAALFYVCFYLTLRQAYLMSDFLTVFAWSRVILIPLVLVFYFVPFLKRKIKTGKVEHHPFSFFSKNGLIFLAAQTIGAVAELSLTYAISLANPALVNSLQGTQYIYIFIFGWILSFYFPGIFKEQLTKRSLLIKALGIVLVSIGVFVMAVYGQVKQERVTIGITYSPREAINFGLDPKESYLKVLDKLNVKAIRLPIYWDEVSEDQQRNDFSGLDFYIEEARKRDVEIILVVGYKQPRWPECFTPPWIESIPQEYRKDRLLNLVAEEVKYFRRYPNIKYWQVENEPLFHFGDCRKEDHISFDFLKEEVALVKQLDPQRKVLIADSGELSTWVQTMSVSDTFGITLYRAVWNPYIGNTTYPVAPFFYSIKNSLVRFFINKPGETIVVELQAEPWPPGQKSLLFVPYKEQMEIFPVDKMRSNLKYGKETGFNGFYFWGTEWWLYMEKNGHPEYMKEFRDIVDEYKER
jgi:hypothetical protein